MGEGVLEGQEEGEREEREGQGLPRKRDLGDLAKVRSYQHIVRDGLSWKAGSESGSRARISKRLRSPGIDSASLCSLAGRYGNPIPTRYLAPIDCSMRCGYYV
jgi:hypothetical protein